MFFLFVLAPLLSVVYTYTRPFTPVSAAPATTLNFQARLVTGSGAIVPDGNYNVVFNIYEDLTGGTSLYTETWSTGTSPVTVRAGYLSVYLGTHNNTLMSLDWTDDKFLTMNVNNDGEMTPRLRMTAVPFAFAAEQANNSNQLQGRTADQFVQLNPGATPQTTNTTNTAIAVNQQGTGNILQLQSGGVDRLTVLNDGVTQFNAGNGNLMVASAGNTRDLGVIRVDAGSTSRFAFSVNRGATTYFSIQGNGNTEINADLALNGSSLTTTSTVFDVFNTNATTVNAFGGATSLLFGANSGVATIRNTTIHVGGLIATSGSITGNTVALNLRSGSSSGISSTSGDVNIESGAGTGTTTNSGNININTGAATGTKGSVILQGNGGNVGIGVVSPNRTLTLPGAGTIGFASAGINLSQSNSTTLNLTNSTVGEVARLSIAGSQTSASSANSEIVLNGVAGGAPDLILRAFRGAFPAQIIANNNSNLRIDAAGGLYLNSDGGNVGIGTTTPTTARLVVRGTTSDNTAAALNVTNSSNNSLFYVRNDGNVGIGTNTPGFRLDVQGGTGIVGRFSGRVIGANAVNTDEFTTLGQVNTLVAGAGGGGVTTVGTIDSQTKSANGAVISGTSLFLQTADATNPGLVSTGAQTFAGAKTFNNGVVLAAQQTITFIGGTTAQRPASPTEGQIYYDTTTKSLLIYTNGKWQADRTESIIVAASNSTQAQRDSADYVAPGTEDSAGAGVGTIDGDQIVINQALAAAAGGKVYLLPGTYTIDGSISIPNNTTLTGSGNGSFIQLGNFGATPVAMSAIINSDTTTGTGVVVENIRLDGRKDLNTAGAQGGIYITGMGSESSETSGVTINTVQVENFRDEDGIELNTVENSIISNSIIKGNDNPGVGIKLTSVQNVVVDSNILMNNQAGINVITSTNVVVSSNTMSVRGGITFTNSSDSVITGNVIADLIGFGILLNGSVTGSNRNTVNGNRVSNVTNQGILMSDLSSYNQVSGNRVSNTLGTNSNGIQMSGGASYNSVVGNIITDDSCPSSCNAINIPSSSAVGNYLADNTIFGDGINTAVINDNGTNTIYGGQLNASGNYLIQPTGTIELLRNTNVTGTLGVSGIATFATLGTANSNSVLCRNSTNQLATCTSTFATTANAFLQNGNSFGAAAVLGTNDNNVLNFRTNNANRLTLDTTGNLLFQQNATISSVGTLSIQSAAATALTLDSGTTGAVNLGTSANAKTITIGNGTGATSLVLNAGTGALNIGTNTVARTVSIGNATGASALNLNSGSGALSINSTTGTINIGTAANARITNLGTGAAAQTVNVGSNNTTSTTTINAGTGGLSLGNNGVANTIQIGNTTGAVTQNLNLGTNDTAASTTNVTIGSTIGTSATTVRAGSTGIALQGNTAITGNLDVSGTIFAGTGDAFQVSSAGAVTAVGVNAGNGLLQGTGGLTITGATSLTGATNINTAGTANTAIGNATGTFTLASSTLNVTAGAVTGVTTLNASGLITLSTLGAADNTNYVCRNSTNQLATCNTTGTGAAFVQGGNSFGAPAVLGTNDANDLQLETNGTTRLTINATTGNATFTGSLTAVDATLSGDLAINGGDITSTGALTVTPAAGSNFNVNLSTTGDFAVNTNQLYVDTSTGRVGIGTAAPAERLTVSTAANAYGLLHTNGSVELGTYVSAAGPTGGGFFGTKSNHPLGFFTNNGSASLILGLNGNLGIGGGISLPSALLSVGASEQFQVNSVGNITTAGNLAVNGGNITSTGALTVGTSGQNLAVQGSYVSITSGGNIDITAGGLIGLNTSSLQFNGGSAARTIRTSNSGSGVTAAITVSTGISTGLNSTSGVASLVSGAGTGTNTSSGNVIVESGTATGTKGSVVLQGNGGNVGIGTATPSARLHVSRGSGDAVLIVEATNSATRAIIEARNDVGGTIRLVMNGSTAASANAGEIQLSGSNPFNILQGGNQRLRVDVSGNVIVGANTSSTSLLHVEASRFNQYLTTLKNTNDGGSGLLVETASGGNADYALRVITRTSTTPIDAFAVRNDGRVGIGTASPTEALDVVGNSTNAVVARVQNTNTGINASAEFSAVNANGVYTAFGTSSPNNGFAQYANNAFVYAQNGINLVTDGNVTSGGSNVIRFLTGGSNPNTQTRMLIDAAGNVGIGTAAPSTVLDIAFAGSGGGLVNPATIRLKNTTTQGSAQLLLQEANDDGVKLRYHSDGGSYNAFEIVGFDALLGDNIIATFQRDSGNVGIGTNNVTARLQVQNTTAATVATLIQGAASQTADLLQVRSSANADLVSINNTGVLRVGNPAAPSLATAKLVVTEAETTTRMVLGSVTNGLDFNTGAGANNFFRLTGNARNLKRIQLFAEYEGAVLSADGTNNVGSMISDFDPTPRMNYYKWTTTQVASQDYDVIVQVPIPQDFDALASTTPLTISVYNSVNTANTIQFQYTDSAGVISNGNGTANAFRDITNATAGAWGNQTIHTTGTTTAGNYVTFRFRLTSPQNGDIRIGNIYLDYLSRF